jgi:hypothetical protein
MFDLMNIEMRRKLVSFCCAGMHCNGDEPSNKTFFHFLAGSPVENKVVLWLRFGRDDWYVKNMEPPSNDNAHWRVVEELFIPYDI